MANSIKYNTGTEASALRMGNFHMGVGNVSKGPTSTTGYYSAVNPPPGGYTIYVHNKNIGPSIQIASNDAELIRITNTIASTSYTTSSECFQYFNGQTDKMVVNSPLNSIVTDGLVLILDASLIPSYPQSGTDWNDLSGQSANAEGVNMPTWNSNGWFTFDGTDDELHSVDMEQEYRDLFFVGRTNKSSGLHMLFGQYNDQDDSLRFEGPYLRTTGNIDPNDWQYGAIGDVFINGEFDALAGGNYDLSNRMNFVRSYRSNDSGFGTSFRYELSTSFYDRRFTGDLAYILCYNRKLTNDEVLHNYFQSPIITDGLVLALDAGNLVSYENGDTTAYSLTGSVDGTLTNGVGFDSGNGGAWEFDGTDDYIAIDNLGLSSHTIEGWFNSDDASQGGAGYATICSIFGNYAGGASKYTYIGLIPNLTFRIDDGATSHAGIVTVSYTANTWYYVALTYDATSGVAKAYVNGDEIGSRNSSANIVFDSIPHNIAKTQVNVHFDGKVASHKTYDRALTAEEVMQNYSAGKGRFSA
tara:strand:- start:78 stop:1658 length:1581 start_codon:yes stop_codon:yes gene_type:complete